MSAARRPGVGYAVLTLFVVTLTWGGIVNFRQNSARERTDRVVCEILAEGAATEQGRLEAYAQEPPATDAGRAQKRASEQALVRWEHRARDLGCPQRE